MSIIDFIRDHTVLEYRMKVHDYIDKHVCGPASYPKYYIDGREYSFDYDDLIELNHIGDYGNVLIYGRTKKTYKLIRSIKEKCSNTKIVGVVDPLDLHYKSDGEKTLSLERGIGKSDCILINLPLRYSDIRYELQKTKLSDDIAVVDLYDISRFIKEYHHPELQKYKNIHSGKRCFLVGTGPSLEIEDLDTLHKNHEICFSGNGIFQVYDRTKWRPDYFVTVDPSVFSVVKDNWEVINADSMIFFRDEYNYSKEFKRDDFPEVNYVHMVPAMGNYNHPPFSLDITESVIDASTLIFSAAQIAMYMGFVEIYLLGVDNSVGMSVKDHFDNEYLEEKHSGIFIKSDINRKRVSIKDRNYTYSCIDFHNQLERVFESADYNIKQNGKRIINATRGGMLEALPRKSFDEVFK